MLARWLVIEEYGSLVAPVGPPHWTRRGAERQRRREARRAAEARLLRLVAEQLSYRVVERTR